MKSPSKKSDLVTSLEALVPVWDLAQPLRELVQHPDFPDEEAEALSAILSDAVRHVRTEGRIEDIRQISGRIQGMLEHERLLKHHEDRSNDFLLSSL